MSTIAYGFGYVLGALLALTCFIGLIAVIITIIIKSWNILKGGE